MKYVFAALLGFLCLSCANEEFQKIDSKNFTLELPGSMSSTTELNDDAVVQYQNVFSELYTIVIEEEFDSLRDYYPEFFEDETNKYQGLMAYATLVTDMYSSTFELKEPLTYSEKMVNGNLAVTTNFNCLIEGEKAYMDFTFIKGKNHFYQIVAWTTEKNKSKFKPDFDKIINSFKDKGTKKESRNKK